MHTGKTNNDSQKTLLIVISLLVFVVFVLASLLLINGNGFSRRSKTMSATVSSASVDVNNSLPEASSASLNGGSAIVLNENTTKSVSVTGTVTDNNSCKDLSQVHVAVYKSGATCTELGHANNDTCYFWTDSNPSNDASCTGFSDTIYDVSHSFDVQYYADPRYMGYNNYTG